MLLSVSVGVVAPETPLPSVRVSPPFVHWYDSGRELVALMLNATLVPVHADVACGCTVIVGSPPTVTTAVSEVA